jgi:hypothetical protein
MLGHMHKRRFPTSIDAEWPGIPECPGIRSDEKQNHIPDSPAVWPDTLRQRRALIERIHDHLRKEGRRLCKCEGRIVIVDLQQGGIVEDHVEPKQFARKAGLLKPWEVAEQ